jgi:DNA-binding transcriptional MerR regulator
MASVYRVGELAGLTGVSVRTLHHYDRIGLLRPTRHTDGGHRLYADGDLLRLQQVLTLRYLGFPLKQIGELLDRPGFDVVASLGAQRRSLRDRISELERIEAVLGELLDRRLSSGNWTWELVVAAAAAAQDGLDKEGTTMEQIKSHYTAEQLKQFEEVGRTAGPEEIRAIEEGWTALLAEVRANHDLDPASPAAQALVDRWDALHERTMRHYQQHPELMQAIRQNYEAGNFEGFDRAPQTADFAFIERVKAARQQAS